MASFYTTNKSGFPAERDTTHNFENVTVDDDSTNARSTPLIAMVPLGIAKGLSHDDMDRGLRIVRVFSLAGKNRPAVDGWFLKPGPFSFLNSMNDEDFRRASSQIDAQDFTLHARLIEVDVFDPKQGGLKSPLFKWKGSSANC